MRGHGCAPESQRCILRASSLGIAARIANAPRALLALAITAATLATLPGCGAGSPIRPLRISGAQVATELVGGWLRRAESPRFDVHYVQPVALSQHGFEGLGAGRIDLACTDRLPAARERAALADQGVQLRGWRIGFFGYALYVHPDNRLDSVFAGHVAMLFRNEITSWHELGAGEGRIRLIGPRKATRGGQILAAQARIFIADPTWEVRESDHEIVQSVASDPLALGFASIGFDHDARYLGLKMNRYEEPAFPSLEEIEREEYGLAKVIYVWVRADDPPAPALEAVEWLRSGVGVEQMRRNRVWPMPADRAEVDG